MVTETITKVAASLSASDINGLLEVQVVYGIIYLFQERRQRSRPCWTGSEPSSTLPVGSFYYLRTAHH